MFLLRTDRTQMKNCALMLSPSLEQCLQDRKDRFDRDLSQFKNDSGHDNQVNESERIPTFLQ